MKVEAMQADADNLSKRLDFMKAIGENLSHLRQAMAWQREYDIATAKSIKDLARILMEGNGRAKTYDDGTTIFVEENRVGRKELAAVTMWKTKNPLAPTLITQATQISDLSRNSEGKDRNGNQTYRLISQDTHNNTLMVELSGDGIYWNISTAGIFKNSYGKNNREIYNRHTTVNQSTETDEASQGAEQRGTAEPSSMNAPESVSKDNKSLTEEQMSTSTSSEVAMRSQQEAEARRIAAERAEAEKAERAAIKYCDS